MTSNETNANREQPTDMANPVAFIGGGKISIVKMNNRTTDVANDALVETMNTICKHDHLPTISDGKWCNPIDNVQNPTIVMATIVEQVVSACLTVFDLLMATFAKTIAYMS